MSEPKGTQPAGGAPSLAAAKKDLEAAWQEESWPEPGHGPTELFHYCGVDGFHGIVTKSKLWLSDILTLNDASEMLYARTIVDEVLRSQHSPPLWLPKGMTSESEFLDGTSSWRMYVSCFCAEGDLLSQWRGYGARGGGIAIGFDLLRLKNHCLATGITNPFPMIYDKEEQRRPVLNLVRRACEIAAKRDLKADEWPDFTEEFIFRLTTYMPQMKNPAFSEESEWRLLKISPDETPKFRPARGIIVPYLELPIPSDVLKSVTLGPAIEPKFGLRPTKLFLESHGMRHVQVRQSQVPLRVVAQSRQDF
jgi:Protein of unknown function (DUF2971)